MCKIRCPLCRKRICDIIATVEGLISDVPLPLGCDGVLWLHDGDFVYL